MAIITEPFGEYFPKSSNIYLLSLLSLLFLVLVYFNNSNSYKIGDILNCIDTLWTLFLISFTEKVKHYFFIECRAELTLEPERGGNSVFCLFVSALNISENWLYSGQFCYNALVFNVDTHKSWVIFLNVFLASSIQWGISAHNFLLIRIFEWEHRKHSIE